MTGELAQLITISSAINGIVNGQADFVSSLMEYSGFSHCHSVDCIDRKPRFYGGYKEVDLHKDLTDWMRSIEIGRISRAWLYCLPSKSPPVPDHISSAFVGGGSQRLLFLSGPRLFEAWKSRWETIPKPWQNNRIWKVTYIRIQKSLNTQPVPQSDLENTYARFLQVLINIKQFANDHQLIYWCECFQRGIDHLTSVESDSLAEGVKIPCFDGYPEKAQRMITAAYSSWVFGGMGSWNDMSFEKKEVQRQYLTLSADLYAILNDAIQHATWSFNRCLDDNSSDK